MSGPVAEMDEGGQEPVDEHEPVLRTGAHSTLPRPRGQLGLVTLMPRRAQLGDEFSDHIGRQARNPAIAEDHCTSHGPHHPTMINHPGLDVSPPTVHELVSPGRPDPVPQPLRVDPQISGDRLIVAPGRDSHNVTASALNSGG